MWLVKLLLVFTTDIRIQRLSALSLNPVVDQYDIAGMVNTVHGFN